MTDPDLEQMTRDELRHEVRRWRFNYDGQRQNVEQIKANWDLWERDYSARLDRIWALVDRTRKTVRMDDLLRAWQPMDDEPDAQPDHTTTDQGRPGAVTTVILHQVQCDAPDCFRNFIAEEQPGDLKPRWRRIRSVDHLDQNHFGSGLSRTRRNQVTWLDVIAGSFTLHLCSTHHRVFDKHLPRTAGHPRSRGASTALVSVGCSCGMSTRTGAVHVVGQKPASAPAFAWLGHLPAELKSATLEAL